MLDLHIERPCTDLVVERATQEEWPRTPFVVGENLLPPEVTDFFVRIQEDDPDTDCCFDYWLINDAPERDTDRTIYFEWWTNTLELVTRSCNPCTPRYKTHELLLSKANCICSNIGVDIVTLQENEFGAFAIYDKCIPEDENQNPFGLPYHVITLVMDPNYLLQTIECLCGGNSNPEYILETTIN